mmetsp:Transcript_93609/g.195166  ORF Transcript_93609/g.195166 Transcript_93609/m.195166 type:complete len:248 (+) Transcript_93609:297-1040(+)
MSIFERRTASWVSSVPSVAGLLARPRGLSKTTSRIVALLLAILFETRSDRCSDRLAGNWQILCARALEASSATSAPREINRSCNGCNSTMSCNRAECFSSLFASSRKERPPPASAPPEEAISRSLRARRRKAMAGLEAGETGPIPSSSPARALTSRRLVNRLPFTNVAASSPARCSTIKKLSESERRKWQGCNQVLSDRELDTWSQKSLGWMAVPTFSSPVVQETSKSATPPSSDCFDRGGETTCSR